jgi:hypothetical protein
VKRRLISLCATAALAVAGVAVWAVGAESASAAGGTGAGYTSVDESVDGSGHCKNGNPNVNCNIYDGKQYVWMNGGPVSSAVGDGTYFFVVLEPGNAGNTDPRPNDGSNQNLSDDFDAYTNRTFTVSGGTVSYGGSHNSDGNKIRLMPYADTANPGGVYIMAICSLAGGYPVDPSSCKYDAFKIQETPVVPAAALTITKDANGSYDNTYQWTISKGVDKTTVKQVGGDATFNYTVTVSHDGGTISNVKVTGTISVLDPNVDDQNNAVPVDIDGVTDQLSDGTVCTVTGGGAQTLTQVKTDFPYECDLTALPQGELDNTATVAWQEQFLADGSLLGPGPASFTFSDISFSENAIDECVNVTDTYAGTLGTVCVGDPNPKSFTYSRTVPVPANGCQSYDNTATFTSNDSGTTDSASQTVTVCGPAKTGALTIGFWKTTNGQNLVKTYCGTDPTGLGAYLRGLDSGTGPFSNAPSTCSSLATYVSGILNGASATNMNNMLKAQMLGTALDVWFSGPGWTSTTISKVKPPSSFLQHNLLGTFKMDTTAVCPMVDNTTAGTATCKNNAPSTDAVASSAVPTSPMSMQAILAFASTTPAPFNGSTSSSVWYGGDRTKQEILKNIFDQFNNQLAFGSF